MSQPSDNLRDRLLAALPQPENLDAYREETSTLLAKHARALRWDHITTYLMTWVAVALAFLWYGNRFHMPTATFHFFQLASALTLVVALVYDVRYRIYKSQTDTLKEIRQVQLQILELQASLQKKP